MILRVLICVLSGFGLALSTPTEAKADPVTTYIVGTVLSLSGAAAAVATFVINAGMTFALNWGAGKLLGRNKTAVQERQASVTSLSLGETPRELVIGQACTGGSLVDAFNHGGQYGTDQVTRCVALADHAVEQLVGYYVDDKYFDFGGNGQQPGFSGCLDMEFVNATADGAAPPARFLTASRGTWSVTDKMAGITHIWVSYKTDEKVWPQGHPQLRFVLKGLRAYDPRFDPALGYVGPNPQTWVDRSTHKHTLNAAVLRYAFTRGIYAEGHQGDPAHLLIGRGLSAEEAPPERIIAWANLCDEVLEGGRVRYAASGVIRANDDFITVEEMFAAAMAGVIVQREGGVEVEPGHAKATVATITDGDLVVGEPVSFSEFLPDGDGGRINTVVPRYVSPAQGWKDHGGTVRRDLADVTADGGPREVTLPLLLVTNWKQADACAEITRRLGRLERRATIVLGPEFSHLEEGDWIAWQSDRRHGGATRTYRIESWGLDEKWRIALVLREIAGSVYADPTAASEPGSPPNPQPDPEAVALAGVTVAAVALSGSAASVPAVRFGWSAPVDPAVRAIRAEVRRVGSTEVASARTEATGDGVLIVTNGVPSAAAVEGRLVPIGDGSRTLTASAWVQVTTGGLVSDPSPEARRRVLEVMLLERLTRTENWLAETERRRALDRDLRDVLDVVVTDVDPVERRGRLRFSDLRLGETNETLSDRFTGLDVYTAQTQADLDVLSDGVGDTGSLFRRAGGGTYVGDLNATHGADWGGNLANRPTWASDGRAGVGLAANGDLARNIPTSVLNGSNVLRFTGGGTYTGVLNANYVNNTAELIDGAQLGLTALWSGIGSRPAELTDGRIAAGLASDGRVLQATLADGSAIKNEEIETALIDGSLRPQVLGPGALVMLGPLVYGSVQGQIDIVQAADGETVSFGKTYALPPILVPVNDNVLQGDFQAGDFHDPWAKDITTTSFRGSNRRRNNGSGGTVTPRVDDGAGDASGTGPVQVILRHKETAGVAMDGTYVATFRARTQSGTIGAGEDQVIQPRKMTVAFEGRSVVNGAWTQLGSVDINSDASSSEPQILTYQVIGLTDWDSWPIFAGSGESGYEYRLNVVSGFRPQMALEEFSSVTWSELVGATAPLNVSALPPGFRTTYLVFPRAPASEATPGE